MKKITFKILLGLSFCFPILVFGQANDNFADAEATTCGGNYTGSTVNATLDEANAPVGFGVDMDAPNVWYSFTGSGTPEKITVNLCNSAFDTSVLVFTGSSGNLTLIAGNDDDNTCGAGLTTRSKVSFDSDGTTTYYIVIEGWNATTTGTYNMDVTCSAIIPPAVANQTCDTALTVSVDGTTNESDNSFGYPTPIQPTCDLFGSVQDVWFSFVAASPTANVSVALGNMTSANFAVYSGDCAAMTSLACRSNLTTTTTQALTNLIAGNTYYVQVWSNAAEQGTFTLVVNDPSVCLPVATFSKSSNCPATETFNVTADITSIASATSVTVTDNQGSVPQTISAAGLVTFGPYNNGTSVILTVTNDQSPTCIVTSAAQTFAACPPANDDCANAVPLTVGVTVTDFPTVGTTIGGTTTTGLGTFSCQTNRNSDVWYSVVVPASGLLTIETNTAAGTLMTDSVISIFSGTCGALTEIGCSDDEGNGNFSLKALTGLTPGATLYVGVWKWGTSAAGEFSISAYDATLANASFDDKNFTYYPNPVTDVLNLAYSKNITSVSVFNVVGQEVMAKSLNSNLSKIDMSHLAKGTYMVKIVADNETKTIKVVKK